MKSESGQGLKELGDAVYLSIVVPLYNEEECVEKLMATILKTSSGFDFSYEIILVDDGSSDNTWQKIVNFKEKTPNLIGIRFRRNFGQTAAMVAGFDHSSGEIIVTMDGDLQNDPSDIPLLLGKLDEGFDIVSGWRKNRQDHFSRVLPSKIANWIISKTTGVYLHDYGCSLKAYRANSIKSIRAYGEMHRFFPALASMTGARVTEIPVQHFSRQFGTSKYGFGRIFKVFNDILAANLIIRFVSKPLIGFAKCSIPLIFFSFLFFNLMVAANLLEWTSGKAITFLIVGALLGSSALLLITLGIIGELVVSFSDLEHTNLSSIMMTEMSFESDEIN